MNNLRDALLTTWQVSIAKTKNVPGRAWSFIKPKLLWVLVIRQVVTIWKLRKAHRDATFTLNDDTPQNLTEKKIKKVQLIDELIMQNVSIAFHRFLLYFIPAFIFLFVFMCMKSCKTTLSMNITASRVTWKVANEDDHLLNSSVWNIESNARKELSIEGAVLKSGREGHAVDNDKAISFVPDTPYTPVKLTNISLINNAYMSLSMQDTVETDFNIYYPPSPVQNPELTFKIRYKNHHVRYNDTAVMKTPEPQRQRELEFGKIMRLQDHQMITLKNAAPWKKKHPIRISELSFDEDGLNSAGSISSVKSGYIRMLETRDSAVNLSEREKVIIKFSEPAELYISADSLIHVQTEGIVSEINVGPRIQDSRSSLMPPRLQTLTDQWPFVVSVAGFMVPLLIALLIRQRKSI